jgi:hypothetical protein
MFDTKWPSHIDFNNLGTKSIGKVTHLDNFLTYMLGQKKSIQ